VRLDGNESLLKHRVYAACISGFPASCRAGCAVVWLTIRARLFYGNFVLLLLAPTSVVLVR